MRSVVGGLGRGALTPPRVARRVSATPVGPFVGPLLLLAGLASVNPSPALGQGLEYVRANYTKYEFRPPMRDGVRLFTSVYVPKDASGAKKYPILMIRTPYGVKPYGVDQHKADLGPSAKFGRSGYIFVHQDVRGRWMSEGEFAHMRPCGQRKAASDADESTDARDTIDWLLANLPHHNGKVGMWGISYPGFYTACALVDAHPALIAASPQAPITDWFVGDDFHHNGALFLPHAFNFLVAQGAPRDAPTNKFEPRFEHGTPDGYDFFLRMGPLSGAAKHFPHEKAFWRDLMARGVYDEFWQARDLRPRLRGAKHSAAVMTVGGWFDAENLFGALETHRALEVAGGDNNNASPRENALVMGPWSHGGWARGDGLSLGHANFHSKTAEFYREEIEFPFFEFHLKEQGARNWPRAWVFQTGLNEWRKHDAWPPRVARPATLYFRSGGALAWTPEPEPQPRVDAHVASPAGADFDEYPSDPAKPVPYFSEIAVAMAPEYMVDDQRHAARRPDVLTYQTEPLESDVTLCGPIEVRLVVSTTGTDADFVVKLIDVCPDDFPDPEPNPRGVKMGGFQQLVRGDVMRGKFRDSFEKPAPFTPNQPTRVNFTLPDICHTFRAGHRVMAQVQSTWFPLVDRNPQKFVDIYRAETGDFQKATHRLHRAGRHVSRLEVRVLP